MSKASTTAKRKYNEKAYDRLAITVPKGHKETVQKAAEAAGESVNSFVTKALLQRMGLSEWPEIDPSAPLDM